MTPSHTLALPARWGRRLASAGLVHPCFAAGGVAALGQLHGAGATAWPVVAAAWLVAYASYLIDSASETAAGAVPASARTRHLQSRRPFVLGCGLLAFGAALGLALLHAGPWAAAGLLVFPASVALYCLPWRRTAPRCVKDVPYAKSFYTAFFWGLLGLWATASLGRAGDPVALAAAFGLFAGRDLLNTVFCDLKDIERDRAQGVRTFALRLGAPRLLQGLGALNLLFPLLLCAAVMAQALPPAALGLALTSVYYAGLLRAAARPGADLEWLCNVAADAEWAPWPLYVAAAGLLAA